LQADVTAISISSVKPTFSITYPRLKAATDASLHAFRSSNLTAASWTRTGVTETMLSDDGTIQIWKASVSSVSPPIFLRLEASQP
jgi:hypothetical protein